MMETTMTTTTHRKLTVNEQTVYNWIRENFSEDDTNNSVISVVDVAKAFNKNISGVLPYIMALSDKGYIYTILFDRNGEYRDEVYLTDTASPDQQTTDPIRSTLDALVDGFREVGYTRFEIEVEAGENPTDVSLYRQVIISFQNNRITPNRATKAMTASVVGLGKVTLDLSGVEVTPHQAAAIARILK